MLKVFLYIFAAYGLLCFIVQNLRAVRLTGYPVFNRRGPELHLVIRVKDSEENIEALVREYVKLNLSLDIPHRLVIVDNGSKDHTRLILKRLSYRYPYLLIGEDSIQGFEAYVETDHKPGDPPNKTIDNLVKLVQRQSV